MADAACFHLYIFAFHHPVLLAFLSCSERVNGLRFFGQMCISELVHVTMSTWKNLRSFWQVDLYVDFGIRNTLKSQLMSSSCLFHFGGTEMMFKLWL